MSNPANIEQILTTLAANDGAILRWQVDESLVAAFEAAHASGAVHFDHANDMYLHPAAVQVDDAGGYTMPEA